MAIKTRFAPSPTGMLHLGGVRTALYSWLYAKQAGGEFVLRIEDTDLERSTLDAVNVILEGLNWLGLSFDEEPVFQTKRMERYNEVLTELKERGFCYPCFCSKERLDNLRESQKRQNLKPRYDGKCRELTDFDLSEPHTIRFRQPSSGTTTFTDMVKGPVSFANAELDDLILVRQDGTPTYNFCVVVDDYDMGISHVIRGDDHLNNTPRQINIMQALNWQLPQYAHIPMILDEDKHKLSKRDGAASILAYKEAGYLPQALLNYLVRLGWSHGDKEVFLLAEMLDLFGFDKVSKSPSAIAPSKLNWLNEHYLRSLPPLELREYLAPFYKELQIDISDIAADRLEAILCLVRERATNLRELATMTSYFFQRPKQLDEKAKARHIKAAICQPLKDFRTELVNITDFTVSNIKQAINVILTKHEIKLPKIAQPIRIALTGSTSSPSIDVTLLYIGQAESIARLDALLAECF